MSFNIKTKNKKIVRNLNVLTEDLNIKKKYNISFKKESNFINNPISYSFHNGFNNDGTLLLNPNIRGTPEIIVDNFGKSLITNNYSYLEGVQYYNEMMPNIITNNSTIVCEFSNLPIKQGFKSLFHFNQNNANIEFLMRNNNTFLVRYYKFDGSGGNMVFPFPVQGLNMFKNFFYIQTDSSGKVNCGLNNSHYNFTSSLTPSPTEILTTKISVKFGGGTSNILDEYYFKINNFYVFNYYLSNVELNFMKNIGRRIFL